tara:strand:- start:1095 stop:1322 length:228 start_codon:yes stop_codon:yes gene_type:complete
LLSQYHQFYGLGVASQFLQAAEDFAESTSATHLLLCTVVNNLPAKTLYESRGWQPYADYHYYVYLPDHDSEALPE